MIPRVAEGTVLRSSLDTGSPEYLANRDAQLALLGELAGELDKVRAGGGPRYSQRHHDRGRLPALVSRFRDDTRRIFDTHGIQSVGYWVPQDAPIKDNTLIYIVSHPSREAATKNWKEFGGDPEWQKVAKASEADGKIVEKVDSTFMDPTDFSGLK